MRAAVTGYFCQQCQKPGGGRGRMVFLPLLALTWRHPCLSPKISDKEDSNRVIFQTECRTTTIGNECVQKYVQFSFLQAVNWTKLTPFFGLHQARTLLPLNFDLRDRVKTLVYNEQIQDVVHLKERICTRTAKYYRGHFWPSACTVF